MMITQAILAAAFLILLSWTAIAHRFGQRAISPTMRDLAWRWSTSALVAGVLIGHWYMPGLGISHRVGSVLPVIGLSFAFDLYVKPDGKPWWKFPGIWFAVGLAAGTILWGQG